MPGSSATEPRAVLLSGVLPALAGAMAFSGKVRPRMRRVIINDR
jgi:hypothetical protein